MRLFIAVNCGGKTLDALAALQNRLRTLGAKGRFSRPENLHLTLAFLGETPESRVAVISRIIAALGADREGGPAELCLNLCRIGCYRHSGKELWWAAPGTGDPGLPPLLALRARLTAALEKAGIGFDRRPFNAHITLGRDIRGIGAGQGAPPQDLPQGGIPVPVRRVSLMKSEHAAGLLVYTELSGYDLPPL
jgi:2'-5' RNA ligase